MQKKKTEKKKKKDYFSLCANILLMFYSFQNIFCFNETIIEF